MKVISQHMTKANSKIKELVMTLRVIAVKNARVSGDLEHIYARVLHQILMILKPYSQNRMQKNNQKLTTEMRTQHHLH